ncbi:hypothetical protein K435DRAFT_664083 [Dendrothele bispora CBS 962.96]|uniref:DUF6589 domain-containing protein n=1 Tax=Dendrothele bispora (strain CBS 962.96) TaxID=1314807 RepID=A0A4S8M398_DENBC|nr:hypothetical protein K435DRAFT_664083 [Dendrothele bispora CBS 962.96]
MRNLASPLDSPFPDTPYDLEKASRPVKRTYTRIETPNIPDLPDFLSESSIPRYDTGSPAPWPLFKPVSVPEESDVEKADAILDLLRKKFTGGIGQFLDVILTSHQEIHAVPLRNWAMVQKWLQGRSAIRVLDNLQKIYDHKYSYPTSKAQLKSEREHHFSPSVELSSIHYAQVAISSWALCLVGNRLHKGIKKLTFDPEDDESDFHTRLPAGSLQPKHIESFSMKKCIERLKRQDTAVWFITECMAASRQKGKAIVKKIRPHPMVQVACISSFIVCRNKYASGYLPLTLGIWHFSCRSHIDVKRIHTRLGLSVADATARNALEQLSIGFMSQLRTTFQAAAKLDILSHSTTLDNTQEHVPIHEYGLGKKSTLRVGCAATACALHGVKPGAFSRSDYIQRVIQNSRSKMTTESLLEDVDWQRMHLVLALHFVRALFDYVPSFDYCQAELSKKFRTGPIAIYRMEEGRKTQVQPLGTNAENEMSTQGMKRAIIDFDEQKGLQPDAFKDMLDWYSGDGGSFAAMLRVRKYGCITQTLREEDIQENYESMTGKIFTCELWHMRATCLNSLAANHYGHEASSDPSSLSRMAAATGMYRPRNFKASSFYPTSRMMNLAWNTKAVDIWRLHLKISNDESIIQYFECLAKNDELPTLDSLIDTAKILVDRYASPHAYQYVLSQELYGKLPEDLRAPTRAEWILPSSMNSTGSNSESVPTSHIEDDEFDGDRVLANSILFMYEYGLWIEAAYAIPEGDIGRFWEVMKIWIFVFAGSSNTNYVTFLLEMYCLIRYESSRDLKDAIFNNLLVNITGELGNWIEKDLLQEHYNRWLEFMIQRSGGTFDDFFHRVLIAPNAEFFLRLRESIEDGFELRRRGKSHTSPHLRNEYKVLLEMFKDEEVHLFCPGRSMGHAAKDLFNEGYV